MDTIKPPDLFKMIEAVVDSNPAFADKTEAKLIIARLCLDYHEAIKKYIDQFDISEILKPIKS